MKLLVLAMLLLVCSCGKTTQNSQERFLLMAKGDSIASSSQQALVQQLGKALSKGGTEYAVDFCQVKTVDITDSLSHLYGARVQRLSDRNRNPLNALKTANDSTVFHAFSKREDQTDTLLAENNLAVYYKRISLGMPTCLQCHGNPQSEIAPATLSKIKSLYPRDKAVGYQLHEFRGMWKVTFSPKP